MWKILLLTAFFVTTGNAADCVPLSFGVDSIVCVCNATYCDDLGSNIPKRLENGSFYWYVSTPDGRRLELSEGKIDSKGKWASDVLTIDVDKKFQKIKGFGGAFTDSAGLNIKKLSSATQDQLIKSYFHPEQGSRYTLGRVPIGGTDFSTRPYTLDDVPNDVTLQNFSLTMEDHDYKIPYMKQALKLNPDLKFFSAAWSAPAWMKTNNKLYGFGFLEEKYYQLYAQYLVKFLDSYKSEGLDIWAISTGNEPLDAILPFGRLNTMGWTPSSVGHWIVNNLGPTLKSSDHKTLILVHDDQRSELPWYIDLLFRNEKARNYSAGIALHWYNDFIAPASLLNITHNHFPEKFILMTEACAGTEIFEFPKVKLGSWERGQEYILSIIQYLQNWSVGWVDWNLALDKFGGPNWINNNVDSPIIVNAGKDEFYKQPMYYAIAHASRFIDPDSHRIKITETGHIKATAALTPDNRVVVMLYNKATTARNILLKDLKKGHIHIEVPPLSMNTITYAL